VALVATALCVDRVAEAAPRGGALSPQMVQAACRLANRFSAGFRQNAPTLRLATAGALSVPAKPDDFLPETPVIGAHASAASPFQFRLPPPIA
jgi:hypothetical protein